MTILPLWSDEPDLLDGPDLSRVQRAVKRADPDGRKFGAAIRRTYDMLLDGVNTGRYRWEQLNKAEKAHCEALVKVNVQRAFDFTDGEVQDYLIGGVEVGFRFSQEFGEWVIPPEAAGRVLLVVWANDLEGDFSVGLVRAETDLLTPRDRRTRTQTLTPLGLRQIMPLAKRQPLPNNVLLRLSKADEAAVMKPAKAQARVNELFRRAQRQKISRVALATVARQAGFLRRVNKGLGKEGIVILGPYKNHQEIAKQLGVPIPGKGEYVSVRLVQRSPGALIDGRQWTVARTRDPVVIAPTLPTPSETEEVELPY